MRINIVDNFDSSFIKYPKHAIKTKGHNSEGFTCARVNAGFTIRCPALTQKPPDISTRVLSTKT